MLQGIGVDLFETERFRTLANKDAFLAATFTDTERKQGEQHRDPDSRWAILFACKEALLKACSIGLSFGSFWRDISFDRDSTATVTGHIKHVLDPSSVIHVAHARSRRLAIGCAFVHTKEKA